MAGYVPPGEIDVTASYSKHLGPRYAGAGLRIQFHYNQEPGIHFRTPVPAEYTRAIERGIRDGMAERFPNFPNTGAIWVVKVFDDPVASSVNSFYLAAIAAIELAHFLAFKIPPDDLAR